MFIKMRSGICIIIAVSMLGLLSCKEARNPPPPQVSPQREAAREFLARSPTAEVVEKIARQEYQVYSAMGVGQFYPGISQLLGQYIEGRYSSVTLEQTTDATQNGEHEAYTEAAERFASEFNRQMVSNMKTRGLLPEPLEVQELHTGFSIDEVTLDTPGDATQLILRKSGGDRFWPIIISPLDGISDVSSELWRELARVGYHNVLLK